MLLVQPSSWGRKAAQGTLPFSELPGIAMFSFLKPHFFALKPYFISSFRFPKFELACLRATTAPFPAPLSGESFFESGAPRRG